MPVHGLYVKFQMEKFQNQENGFWRDGLLENGPPLAWRLALYPALPSNPPRGVGVDLDRGPRVRPGLIACRGASPRQRQWGEDDAR
jgi:hypothetical protein